MAEMNITLEKVAHDSIKQVLQNTADKFGLVIHRVDVTWIDLSSTEHPAYLVKEIRTEMTSR
ncbi:MAG: hypothetical protein SVK08_00645 [Halobacteriota archaeon]|nr:hypothetical protein [Halobacteriota archaeon]